MLFGNPKMKTTLLLFSVVMPFLVWSQSPAREITPLVTRNGVMVVYNFPNSHFTIRVEGKDVRPMQRPFVFLIDNRALQLVLVNTADITGLAACKTIADSLKAHRAYEVGYLEGVVKTKITVAEDEFIDHPSGPMLFWRFSLPDAMNAQLPHQLFVTFIVGDKLLAISSPGSKTDSLDEIKSWLVRFAATRIVYPGPIDIDKLTELIKKE